MSISQKKNTMINKVQQIDFFKIKTDKKHKVEILQVFG